MIRLSLLIGALSMTVPAFAQQPPRWTLVIHGGAGVIERGRLSAAQEAEITAALDRALQAGGAILDGGGTALDAVEAAVRILEDDPNFNAGRGAVLTYQGTTELDAAIMEGAGRKAGAVTGVSRTKNPVSLARKVMEDSPHVFLSRQGADEFSAEQGLEQVNPAYFVTPERARQLEELKARQSTGAANGTAWFDIDMKYGTVGAVARDTQGHVAAATSTGGITGKRWGRIGDSPIIGAGTYADDRACAVSATGAGEYFIRVGVAHEICARVRLNGESLGTAADAVLAELGAMGGTGGVILTGPGGDAEWRFNTAGMYRGKWVAGGERAVAIYGDGESATVPAQ